MDGWATTDAGRVPTSSPNLTIEHVRALLDTVDKGVVVANLEGRVLVVNARGRKYLEAHGKDETTPLNIFADVLNIDPKTISQRIENGENQLELEGRTSIKGYRARVQWLAESDWIAIQFENDEEEENSAESAAQLTVQELLQEREITYRNLLAAYLKLQEVNRQKTVFLASAAHELKTPLAVIKGYYDLLLTGSLGRLSEKQKDILEESKESCERLVRLVDADWDRVHVFELCQACGGKTRVLGTAEVEEDREFYVI